VKQTWSCLAALLVTGLGASLTHAETVGGIDFPSAPAGFELRSVIDNEKSNPGLGVTLLYNAPGVKASVFVYDDSQPSIPDGVAGAAVRDQFATAVGHVKQFYPDAQSLARETKVTIAGIPLLYTAFTYTEVQPGSRETAMSHLYLTAYKGSFIKVRVTYSGVDRPDLGYRTQVNFVESLFDAIAD
jgi:hypothetical protein